MKAAETTQEQKVRTTYNFMPLNIKTGKMKQAVRALVYSNAGFGKTAWASALPNPLFIDIEGSSERYNVSRVEAKTEDEVKHVIRELIIDQQGFKSLVIDTADWLESAIAEAMCKQYKAVSIAECSGSFGKGYIELGSRFCDILSMCDVLIYKGMNIVFLAHSVVKKVSPPDQMESYDRYEIALDPKNVSAPLREWAEMILFGKFETTLIKTKEKKIKADLGEQSRILYTTNSAGWDAKNRFGLPSELPIKSVEFAADGTIPKDIMPPELAAVFDGVAAREEVKKHAAIVFPKTEDPRITEEQKALLEQYQKVALCQPIIKEGMDRFVAMEFSDLTEKQAGKIITKCQEKMNS